MIYINSNPPDLECPNFTEFNFVITPQALNPRYTLDMHLPVNAETASKVPINELQTYCEQLFGKLIALNEYEFVPLIYYKLYKVADRRGWLEACLLLVVNNRDLYLRSCKLEKYLYLFKLLTELYDVQCNASQMPLYENCEECRHLFTNRVFHDLKMLKNIPHAERTCILQKMIESINHFDKIRNLEFEDVLQEMVEFEKKMNDLDLQFENELKDHLENLEMTAVSGLKKISANCNGGDCVKIIADFLYNYKDEDGVYVFDLNNSTLSNLMPHIFYFKIGNQLAPSTFRDKLDSKEKIKENHDKPGPKR